MSRVAWPADAEALDRVIWSADAGALGGVLMTDSWVVVALCPA